YAILKDKESLKVAEASMEFLESVTFKDGYFKPIGCKGWYKKGDKKAEFDEQPIEACETALMYIEAYKIFGKEEYLEKAKKCYRWFLGDNSQGISLFDEMTGGCYDGITEDGVNLNEGAESLISLIITDMIVNHTAKVYR
ncbi:MAG: glycosyltransferase, partial [Caldanaerobacter sp.]